MSMRYNGNVPSIAGSSCYAFAFRRVKKEWLPEDDCSVTTKVECKMTEFSDYAGEDCAGNIINIDDKKCEMIPVKFKYQICFWNVPMNGVSRMVFTNNQSFIKFDGDKVTPSFNKIDLNSKKKCRETVTLQEIDSCADKAFSVIQVRGSLEDGGAECKSFSSLQVTPAVPCDFQFILTEIANNKNGGTYVEIYSPNCKSAIVTEEYSIMRYKGGKKKGSLETVRLKGKMTDENGFITVCKQRTKVNKIYGKGSCSIDGGAQSAADVKGVDNVAIIKGFANADFEILDIYGVPGESGSGTDRAFTNARAVRFGNVESPNPTWDKYQWYVSTTEGDPKDWDTTTKGTSAPNAQPSIPLTPTKSPGTKPSSSCKGKNCDK